MPGLAQRNEHFSNASSYLSSSSSSSSCFNKSVSSNGFWSKHGNDISYNQLQKFWSELSPQARQKLLRVDKQTLFEQARKNMYCSRCNGLLLEGFLQIVMYGKSLQQEGGAGGHSCCSRPGVLKSLTDGGLCTSNGCQDEAQDPSVHPWGGLTTTRDGTLTLLDCYLCSKSLKGLQNVFDSARARERERELLYPDACGGGGRGWISHGIPSYGRGHGTRETCALHTARLSCDTLVDFWSALGEETRQSLLRMKEEDFIERLMYRFDSKRFCRDCRRNVIREFKELKELKRMRREPHCTSWFCAADTAFQYKVSDDTVQADWCQTFADTVGTYHHFEWAIGTGDGKSDILEYENVGLSGSAQVNGLELGGLNACYITLRACKLDGRNTEISAKAHALKGQQCVHCRLVVGDGFVAITRGESIRRFFEHAEEAEEEEDDDSMDKDGNELDGDCSRPQKHAKSPELAREFLLDAATVIFKEQVEKAFREGTARQNAHSIFVCLALKLLEERVHVACKEIITLEKQTKLLEEEEKEKREEEERKERRRTKEREKKLRRKERLKEKERDRENKCFNLNEKSFVSDDAEEETPPNICDKVICSMDSVCDSADIILSRPQSPEVQDATLSNGNVDSEFQNHSDDSPDGEYSCPRDGSGAFMVEQSKFSRRRSKYRREFQLDSSMKWSDRRRFGSEGGTLANKPEARFHGEKFEAPSKGVNGVRQLRMNSVKCSSRSTGFKFGEKFQCSHNRMSDRYDSHSCSCNQHCDYRAKVEPHVPGARLGRETRSFGKSESVFDLSKQFYRGNKLNQLDYIRESCGRSKGKISTGNNATSRDSLHTKKVWEPMESKKYPRSNSDSDVTLRSSVFKFDGKGPANNHPISSDSVDLGDLDCEDNNMKKSKASSQDMDSVQQNRFDEELKSPCFSTEAADEEVGLFPMRNSSMSVTSDPNMSSTSNSDNCSSCLSEGDSNTASSNPPNMESLSTSDSEDASSHSEGRDAPLCPEVESRECTGMDKQQTTGGKEALKSSVLSGFPTGGTSKILEDSPNKSAHRPNIENPHVSVGSRHQGTIPATNNQNLHFPMFQAPPTMGFYHQNPVSWPAAPANGLIPFPYPNHYLFASPLGYGLNGNSRFCMQYGALPHLPTTLFNPGQGTVYHPVVSADGINTKEQTKVTRPAEALEGSIAFKSANAVGVVPAGLRPTEAVRCGEVEQKGNPAKVHKGNNGFSLFHFGGPVAMSNGHKSDSKEEAVGDVALKLSGDNVDGDHACSKKETTIEEYNLFAAGNGIRFPFL